MNRPLPINVVFGIVICLLGEYKALSYDINENQILEELLRPQENPSMQVRALRRELLRRVQDALGQLDDDENEQESLAALARMDKRNLEALARAGYIKTLPENEEDADANYKRSLANLAKNGQLPIKQEEQKRGIESLARNGELRLKNIHSLLENPSDKRHLGSILKGYDVSLAGKRSLSSLAKSGDLGYYKHVQYKRSPAPQKESGASDKQVHNRVSKQSSDNPTSKQKLLSDDNRDAKRGKRDVDYYYENDENYPSVYQNVYDYDDLIKDLHTAYSRVGKRFLGRLPQMGKPKSTATPKSRRYY